jgi:hypothetical protein
LTVIFNRDPRAAVISLILPGQRPIVVHGVDDHAGLARRGEIGSHTRADGTGDTGKQRIDIGVHRIERVLRGGRYARNQVNAAGPDKGVGVVYKVGSWLTTNPPMMVMPRGRRSSFNKRPPLKQALCQLAVDSALNCDRVNRTSAGRPAQRPILFFVFLSPFLFPRRFRWSARHQDPDFSR